MATRKGSGNLKAGRDTIQTDSIELTSFSHANQTKPNQTMSQYKAITRVPHLNEPFVDWYVAETEDQARAMWEIDREDSGLPVNASVKFEKQ
jgi:hypothetical protein